MKMGILVVVTGLLAMTWVCWAGEQGDVFASLHCGACHKPEESSKSFPSLKEIAKAYEGKEGQSILRPEDAS